MATMYSIVLSGIWNGVNIISQLMEGSISDGTRRVIVAKKELKNKGETIHDYYVRFAKLINDMRNIKMTMSKIQLNSKFVNNMLPEWGRFVTAVKLNKGLKDSNFDQLYAYLKQHEAHANENKMMLERLTQQTVDPLALMSNVSPQHYHSQSSTIPPTTYHQPHSADTSQSDLGLSLTDNLIENLTNILALLTQSYKTFLPQTNNQLKTSSNPRNQAIVQLVIGEHRTEWGMLIQNGVVLDEEQLLFQAGGQDNAIDEDVDEQPVQDLALNVDGVFQADECDAYDSDVDEAPTVQFVMKPVRLMIRTSYLSNMTPYDQYVKDNAVPVVQNNASMVPNDAYVMIDNDVHESDVLSVSHTPRNTVVNNLLNAELATYKEQVELYERRARFELTEREQKIDEQLRIVICDRNIKEENLKKELHS
ncbi:hypothetical protein Tco_1096517, partial [Tanacetum coccineum]